MSRKGSFFSVLIAVISTFIYSQLASANESIGFSYTNIQPENQISEGDYFDLLVKPNHKQTVTTKIKNTSQEDIKIKVTINNATTTSVGTIDYGENTLKHTNNFEDKITDFVKAPSEIDIKKGETKDLHLQLNLPNRLVKGVLLGGVELQRVLPKVAEHNLSNEFVYTFSISLQMNLDPVDSVVKIEKARRKENEVVVAINNESPVILKQLNVETNIISRNNQKILKEHKLSQIKMAPHSVMEYTISLDKLGVDEYDIVTKVTNGQQIWTSYQKNKNPQVRKTVFIEKRKQYIFLLFLSLLFFFSLAIVFIKKKRKEPL